MSTTAPWGQSKTFALSVDDQSIDTEVVTGTTLWITWDTTRTTNGAHTLTLKVTDQTGVTAAVSRSVNVAN
jgi:hypothetical protein